VIGESKVKAFAGAAADAIPIPTQSSCKKLRRSMRPSQKMRVLHTETLNGEASFQIGLADVFEHAPAVVSKVPLLPQPHGRPAAVLGDELYAGEDRRPIGGRRTRMSAPESYPQ
jgi:hypothetical protein